MIVKWQYDLVNTNKTVLPLYDQPFPTNERKVQKGDEIEVLWNWVLGCLVQINCNECCLFINPLDSKKTYTDNKEVEDLQSLNAIRRSCHAWYHFLRWCISSGKWNVTFTLKIFVSFLNSTMHLFIRLGWVYVFLTTISFSFNFIVSMNIQQWHGITHGFDIQKKK